MMAVLDHLQKASTRGDVREEPLQEAIFAISNAYSLNMHNAATRERYPLDGLPLPEVYKVGRAQLLNKAPPPTPSSSDKPVDVETDTHAMNVEKPRALEDDATFLKFISKLKETTDFFKGVEEGGSEYERRLSRARDKFESKQKEKRQKLEKESAARQTETCKAADKAIAEKLKIEGNNELKAQNYQKAHELYTKCIELDEANAIYYSNRAAARMQLSLYMESVEDCKRAIALDREFVRPRERLALAYRHLGMTQNEIDALRGAIRVAPHKDSLVQQLREAEDRVIRESNGQAGGSRAANAGAGTAAGMGAGAGGWDSMLNGLTADPSMLSSMSRAMGLNLPAEAIESFLGSDAASQIGNMIRQNPGVVQNAMQAMMGSSGMAEAMSGLAPNLGNETPENNANTSTNGSVNRNDEG